MAYSIKDSLTGLSKGFGYIEFEKNKSVDEVLEYQKKQSHMLSNNRFVCEAYVKRGKRYNSDFIEEEEADKQIDPKGKIHPIPNPPTSIPNHIVSFPPHNFWRKKTDPVSFEGVGHSEFLTFDDNYALRFGILKRAFLSSARLYSIELPNELSLLQATMFINLPHNMEYSNHYTKSSTR